MTKKRIIITAALLTIVVAAAAAGAWMYGNRFGAGDYVQAVLDVSYKNETELYTEITGISAEEASQIFEENLDATMGEFEGSDMPEDLLPLYRELFRTIAREGQLYGGGAAESRGRGESVYGSGEGQAGLPLSGYICHLPDPGAGIRGPGDGPCDGWGRDAV